MAGDSSGFSQEHIEHYREHGYVIVENFLSADELSRSHDEIEMFIPGWLDYARDPAGPKPAGWDQAKDRRRVRFPFSGSQLNANTLHPELRRFAAIMAGGNPIVCEQSDLSIKCKGHRNDQEQHMHVDYNNHTLAYPPDLPTFWQTAYLLYYTDVSEAQAPTAVCSRRHYTERILWPTSYSPKARPELYANEVKTIVPAGSLLAYSMRTFHRGTAFTAEGARVAQFITYSPAGYPWLGIVGWPEQAVRPEFTTWLESASLEDRALFGFPPPGHPYWTQETLDGVSARYPNMDMTPYKT